MGTPAAVAVEVIRGAEKSNAADSVAAEKKQVCVFTFRATGCSCALDAQYDRVAYWTRTGLVVYTVCNGETQSQKARSEPDRRTARGIV
jgi:hypothetical protein